MDDVTIACQSVFGEKGRKEEKRESMSAQLTGIDHN